MGQQPRDMKLFWACFISLIATSFGFIVRATIMDDWAKQFGLSETQKGEIFGAGLWPFAISIVLFSLVIDRIGYGLAMAFAFVCHVAYMGIVIAAPTIAGSDPKTGYWVLYFGSFVGALGNGTVEAVINPVVATMFSRDKTKWLNILHAGWPGGLVLGGLLALGLGMAHIDDWRVKVGLVGIPVLLYGALMLTCKFPVNERVAAGVSFRDMLKEVGFFGAFLVSLLIVSELTNVAQKFGVVSSGRTRWPRRSPPPSSGWSSCPATSSSTWASAPPSHFVVGAVHLVARPAHVRVPHAHHDPAGHHRAGHRLVDQRPHGREMMAKLKPAGHDGADLHVVHHALPAAVRGRPARPRPHPARPPGGVVGHRRRSASLACRWATGAALILGVATLYGFGKTFFWPTMLGVVAERFPRGGGADAQRHQRAGDAGRGHPRQPAPGQRPGQGDRQGPGWPTSRPCTPRCMGPSKPSLFGEYRPAGRRQAGRRL